MRKHTIAAEPFARLLLIVSWLGVIGIGAGVAGFTLRATGIGQALGPPAVGSSTYSALAIGIFRVSCRVIATAGAFSAPPHDQHRETASKTAS